jgi:peptidoglycan/LPS O-acetylase OafA/YrhL
MAGFSFTLYCIHTPLLDFMGLIMLSLWGTGSHMLPSSEAFLIYGANVLMCLVVAYLLSLATERHTYQLRILMARKMREVRDYWTRTPITP